jgi:Ca2+:H+ antiporter
MIFTWLLLLIPLSLGLHYFVQPGPVWTIALAILAIIRLAEWIRRATKQLAARAGPAIGGLLNVTFGNTADLVLAHFVLRTGHPEVVEGADHRFDHRQQPSRARFGGGGRQLGTRTADL